MTTATDARVGEYEVMLLSTQSAAATLGELIEHINEVFTRASAEVIAMRKWDDRRLAYEIDKQKRGVYFLAYVRCPSDQIAHIERDVSISEHLMRVLITKADHLTDEEMTSHDQREQLADEARMKGSEVREDEGSRKVHLGAPEQHERADAPAPAAEAQSEGAEPAEPAADQPEAASTEGDEINNG